MKIEIVTHCWRYSRVLTYQLSSLVLHPPKDCDVVATVFYSRDDLATVRVLEFFRPQFAEQYFFRPQSANRRGLRAWPLPTADLLNRAIGRNAACRNTNADIVWFTDCDYVFGEGCLDALAATDLPVEKKLFYPPTKFTVDHATGDAYAERAAEPAVLDIDPADFKPHKCGKAIGGIQIVPGSVAREYGYCPNHKRHQRHINGEEFKKNTSDKTYRQILGVGGGTRIELPNVYRIRQTDMGMVDILWRSDVSL